MRGIKEEEGGSPKDDKQEMWYVNGGIQDEKRPCSLFPNNWSQCHFEFPAKNLQLYPIWEMYYKEEILFFSYSNKEVTAHDSKNSNRNMRQLDTFE